MTYPWDNAQPGTNSMLLDGPADWVSPHSTLQVPPPYDYRCNPLPARGDKVVILDTDHLWGVGGDAVWVWKAFTRGHNPIFMDPWEDPIHGAAIRPALVAARGALGHTAAYARRMDLMHTQPRMDLASTGYCLSDGRSTYLVFQPERGAFTVWPAAGRYHREWLRLDTAEIVDDAQLDVGNEPCYLSPPFDAQAVLFLWRA
jgi:hypothetical protein